VTQHEKVARLIFWGPGLVVLGDEDEDIISHARLPHSE
jgi:hypothetical protein